MEKKVQGDVLRKRGRPAGKNRVPLSQAERRARNAQYEKERRVEMADAFAELAEAAGCSKPISNADLLATVITQLQQASRDDAKHNRELESLKRCNNNLMAQIETLEQRLAEADDGYPVSAKKEEADVSRPVKGKRDAMCNSVSKRSPVEHKYTPPAHSPEQKYFSEPSPPPVHFSEQHFDSEPKYSPESKFQPENAFDLEPKYSPKQEFQPTESQIPVSSATLAQRVMPVPKVSPLSNSSDHQPVDCSFYNFADVQIPTPEYILPLEPMEYVLPAHSAPLHYECQLSPQKYLTGPSSRVEQYSPTQYIIPASDYGAVQQHSEYQVPVQPNVVGSVGILPMPGASMSRDVDPPVQDHQQIHFLSTEDLISMYL